MRLLRRGRIVGFIAVVLVGIMGAMLPASAATLGGKVIDSQAFQLVSGQTVRLALTPGLPCQSPSGSTKGTVDVSVTDATVTNPVYGSFGETVRSHLKRGSWQIQLIDITADSNNNIVGCSIRPPSKTFWSSSVCYTTKATTHAALTVGQNAVQVFVSRKGHIDSGLVSAAFYTQVAPAPAPTTTTERSHD
jgi:hypothetical protein